MLPSFLQYWSRGKPSASVPHPTTLFCHSAFSTLLVTFYFLDGCWVGEEEERKADVECRWIREPVRLVRLFLFVSLPRMLSLIPAHLVPISCPPSCPTPQVLASEVKQNHACQRPGQALAGRSSLTYAPALVLQWRWCGVWRRLILSLAGDAMCRLHATAHAASYAIPTSAEATSTSHPAPPSLRCLVSLPHAAFALHLLRRRASPR